MNIPEKMCRLCLKKCNSSEAIDGYIEDILGILMLKINPAVSEDPVMCANCADMIRKCFDFKSVCLDNHDYLASLVENNSKMNLRDVFHSKQENVIDVPDDRSVCGFCMGLINNSSAISLCSEQKNVVVEIMLEKYLPELDLNIIEEPIICTSCDTFLKNWFQFVMNCLSADGSVIVYNEAAGEGVGKSSDVLQTTIKQENCNEEEDNIDNALIKIEDETFLLDEKIEIKTEDSDSDRFQCSDVTGAVKMFKRESCSFQTDSRNDLKVHQKQHTKPSGVMYSCESCSYKTKYIGTIKRHIVTHKDPSEITFFDCDSCSFQTKHRNCLRAHKLTHKDPSEITMFTCESCPFKTKYRKNLKQHNLTHKDLSEITAFKCESCPYKTKYSNNLKQHNKLMHQDLSEIPMFKCDSCPFQTKRKNSLKGHMRTHGKPKLFSNCLEDFQNKSDL